MQRRHSNCIHEVINPQIYIIQSNLKKPKQTHLYLIYFKLNLVYVLMLIYLNCFATTPAQCMLVSFLV